MDENGNASGGPMYYIEQGLGKKFKPLAVMFSIFGVMTACLGSGTFTQVNAITSIVNVSFGVSEYVVAAILTVLVAVVIIGGLQSIANVASKIVPFMAAVYVIVTVSVLVFMLMLFRQQLSWLSTVPSTVLRQQAALPVPELCWQCAAVSPAVFIPTNPAWALLLS